MSLAAWDVLWKSPLDLPTLLTRTLTEVAYNGAVGMAFLALLMPVVTLVLLHVLVQRVWSEVAQNLSWQGHG